MGDMMKKIILIIAMCFVSVCTTFAKPIEAKGGTLYINQEIIEGTTPYVEFSIVDLEVSFPGKTHNKKDFYFEVKNGVSNGFITLQNIRVSSGTHVIKGNEIYFERLDGVPMENWDSIKITITGTLIFNWSYTPNYILEIGNVTLENTDQVIIDFGSYDIDDSLVSKLGIKVASDLHLGFGVAGEVLDSSKGSGYPAEINLTCADTNKYSNVRLTVMPQKIKIYNTANHDYEKDVTLRFRNITNTTLSGDNLEAIVPLEENITVFIDGNMPTNVSDPEGRYEGTFTLRATYE